MHPILFSLGPLTIPTYGFCMAVGFSLAFIVSAKQCEDEGIDGDLVANLFFIIVLSAVLGSRALYVFLHYERFLDDPLAALMLWRGGLVFYGGLCTATVASLWYCRHVDLPIGRTADALAPQLALGHVFGRLGCFAYGCCYGTASTLPWAVVFPHDPTRTPRHPTQLYEAAAELIIFYLLTKLYHRRPKTGTVMMAYLMLYSMFRFAVEFVRADNRGGTFLYCFSIAQVTAIVIMVLAIFVLRMLYSNGRNR